VIGNRGRKVGKGNFSEDSICVAVQLVEQELRMAADDKGMKYAIILWDSRPSLYMESDIPRVLSYPNAVTYVFVLQIFMKCFNYRMATANIPCCRVRVQTVKSIVRHE
jgi:hypothetical protein